MKTKTLKENKVNIITLGCSKNIVDSEVIMTQLKGNGIDVVHEAEDDKFNIVLINTCGFIGHAKTESVETILRYADAKKEGLVDKVYVSGCLSERYKEDLVQEIPEVDAFFGTREVPNLLRALNADYKKELLGERLLTTDKHFGYLKIAEGCDRPCSFCAIPLMRGKHVSVPIEDLVKQAEDMVAKGVKELLLIAQDLTYYGLDIYKKRRLADLLRALSDVEGLEWIRLHYAYPTGFPMDVLDVMVERDNIANYLDIPLQHGSTAMLKRMRRGTSREKQEELINAIREKVPGIAIRTTLITGHPGETEEEYNEMYDFVERMQFERVGVFTYSHEEDTHAGDDMEDDVPEDVKQDRADEIMQLQEEISDALNQKKVGKVYKVLFDKIEGGYFVGRTEFDSPEVDNEVLVPVTEENHVRLGDFANVKITSAEPFDLYGEVVK
ncbi:MULTISPECIES: 30S ribosomal protein S12 methylthiotransferase RimO [unclassified Flammeovirga]|uniref:30S ribosomal protein S12 methylthiotransferase RimO n=1 Tax=unclassified Flammeovirga TaxID=2637820 RepID=UPI0005C4D095|nr:MULTISPECIES: 30S ribosomal protein S12 methylthiotransferase RimO [unclassified Flammeovirga]MBD0400423.1 30S ribosomal protein S12 methylthiotransferase RimO [Flammeovirga sp. EKP202]